MSQPLDFLAGGGKTGALMRAHDWSESPLGPPDTWPQSLRTVVSLLLQSQFPMFVAWGPDLGFLYNDPYAEILGAKHPRALGRRFYDIWSEIWPDISPLIDAAMAGHATYHEDLPLLMNRKGYDEQTWFTFSYSPVRDESGTVAGIFCACSETTQKVLVERAMRESEARLRELNETLERRVTEAIAERNILADIVERTNAFVQVVDLDTGGWPLTAPPQTNSNGSSAHVHGSVSASSTCSPINRTIRRQSQPCGAVRWPAKSSPRSRSSAIRRAIAVSTRCDSTRCAIVTVSASAHISLCTT